MQKIVSPFRAILGLPNGKKRQLFQEVATATPAGVVLEEKFPKGYHVYGFHSGPSGGSEIMIGAGNPATSKGAVFLGSPGTWRQVDLPDETAMLSTFFRFPNGNYVAGGMSSIGRGAILLGNKTATEWKSIELDLHPYSSIAALCKTPDGSLLASAGQMITQGKTKPVIFRSTDSGATWVKEEHKLPITMFLSFEVAPNGTIYAGTMGDHTPMMYRSNDHCRTFEAMPPFPGYKTYKMLSVKLVNERLYVLLWGYKTEIADRVVRMYVSNPDFSGWEELPPIEESHFIFSFLVSSAGTFYAGSEKGKVFKSDDFGQSWKMVTQFTTNIGAYALHEDSTGKIWIGKDFVSPSEYSLWRIA